MFSDSLWRRNVASQILGISALIAVSVACGCSSSYGGGGGGGGGTPSLAASVAGTGNFSSGEVGATYTITVRNSGTAATSGTVTVADPPTGFTITMMSGSGWTCTLSTTTCTYSSYVTAGQSFPPITVTGNVTSANGTSVTIPLTLSGGGAASVNVTPTPSIAVAAPPCALPLLGNENLLSGTYVGLQNGWFDPFLVLIPGVTDRGPAQVAVAFVTNGTGTVSSGEAVANFVDAYSSAGFTETGPVFLTITSSCYNLGPDLRGLMIWNFAAGGSVTNAFSVRADGTLGRFIKFDDASPSTSPGSRAAGFFKKQTAAPATPAGSFAFGTTGYSPNGSNTDYRREGAVGRLTSTAGTVSAGAVNVAFATGSGTQTNVDNQSFTGSFGAPGSFGGGTLTLNFANFAGLCSTPPCPLTLTFEYFTIDATHLLLQSIDTPNSTGRPLQNGEAIAQTGSFGQGSLTGNAVFSMTGGDLSSNHAFTSTAVGQVNSDGAGSANVRIDEVSTGSIVGVGNAQITGGSFTASANGMGTLTFGPTSPLHVATVAMYGQNAGFMLEGTQASPGSNVLVGDIQPQTAPAGGFVNGTFSGLYSFGADQPASTDSTLDVGSGTAAPNTSPASFSGKSDESSGAFCSTNCLVTDQMVSQTYSVDGNGRITVTHIIAGGTTVGWLNDSKNAVVIGNNNLQSGTILKLHQ